MEQITRLKQYIEESNNIVFFGGAGVSTESGIPDFRSKDGLYNQHDVNFAQYNPEYLLSRECLYAHPKVFYEFYRQKMDVRGVQPNITHYYLAELERQGKLKAIVTQNIDGLHQKAGSNIVHEIHGTTQKCYCSICGQSYHKDFIFNTNASIPRCECGGLIRPNVTLYGENLPDDAVDNALNAIRNADMLIIAGTSLSVYPAANFIYDFHGEHMIVINKDKIENMQLNPECDIQINDSLGNVIRKLQSETEKEAIND